MSKPLDLKNKQILVVGVSSKIGEEIVTALAGLGASVVIVGTEAERLTEIQNKVANVKAHCFDFYTVDEIQSNVKTIVADHGAFDGFVFAGGTGGVRPLAVTKNKFVHNMLSANFYTFIELARCVSKKANFSEGGSIVAISSVSSIKGLKAKSAYSASKAALDASIKNMAAELSDRKVRVNTIQKGWVSSDLNLDFIQDNMKLDSDNDFSKQVLGIIEPYEIANTVAFLLSDATKSITGTNLLLDGGYTL